MARRFLRDVRRGPMMRTLQSGLETVLVVAGQSPDRRRTPVVALASGLALCLLVFAIAPSVQAASPTPIAQPAGGPSGGDCFLGICDPGAWLQDAVGRILTNVLGGLSAASAASQAQSRRFLTTPTSCCARQRRSAVA